MIRLTNVQRPLQLLASFFPVCHTIFDIKFNGKYSKLLRVAKPGSFSIQKNTIDVFDAAKPDFPWTDPKGKFRERKPTSKVPLLSGQSTN